MAIPFSLKIDAEGMEWEFWPDWIGSFHDCEVSVTNKIMLLATIVIQITAKIFGFSNLIKSLYECISKMIIS